MGKKVNTAHAAKPRRISSTHASSKVIQAGLFATLLGLARSQNSSVRILLTIVTGFKDQLSFMAKAVNLAAFPMTEPVGGRLTYLLRQKTMSCQQLSSLEQGSQYSLSVASTGRGSSARGRLARSQHTSRHIPLRSDQEGRRH